MHNSVPQYIPTLPYYVVGEGTPLKSHSNFFKFSNLEVHNWFSANSPIVSCDDTRSHSAIGISRHYMGRFLAIYRQLKLMVYLKMVGFGGRPLVLDPTVDT